MLAARYGLSGALDLRKPLQKGAALSSLGAALLKCLSTALPCGFTLEFNLIREMVSCLLKEAFQFFSKES